MHFGYVLLFISLRCFAQPLTETQKLASLSKVWGFLKYHHPAVARGRLDWDGQLVTLLSSVQRAQNRDELSAIYTQLIDSLGTVKPCRKCASPEAVSAHLRRNFDLSLLNDLTVFSASLRDRLRFVAANRNQGENHYVHVVRKVGNTNYDNEKPYAEMRNPDEAHRLLALFRYWNIVQYFFPYKYAIDKNWNDVLTDLIPVFRQADSEQAYQMALYRMVAQIQDSHGFMNNSNKTICLRCDRGRYWLPFEIKIIDDKAVITRFYNDSLAVLNKLKVGMVISHIDGETIRAHIERERIYVAASNEWTFLRDVVTMIGVGTTEQTTLTIDAGDRDSVLTVGRYAYGAFGKQAYKSVNSRYLISRWLPDSIGYVNMGLLTIQQVDSVMKPLLSARFLIFDIRNYPRGTYWLVSRYLTKQPVVFVEFTGPDLSFLGIYQSVSATKLPWPNKKSYRGNVIILVNEETQSQAEFTTMALQKSTNATVVGSQTAGADGNINWIPLPGGYRTAFSGIGVYYPNGRETQRIGILPDIFIRPTIQGIRDGRDEVLERAVDVARQKK